MLSIEEIPVSETWQRFNDLLNWAESQYTPADLCVEIGDCSAPPSERDWSLLEIDPDRPGEAEERQRLIAENFRRCKIRPDREPIPVVEAHGPMGMFIHDLTVALSGEGN